MKAAVISQQQSAKRESRILRIDGQFEIWGLFVDGVLVSQRRLRTPFHAR